ncbi:hypothetical protein EJ02DRAFT_325745, partial [Clathrospora elynae]
MSSPSNSSICCLVERNKRNSPPPSLSIMPTVRDTASGIWACNTNEPVVVVQADLPNNNNNYLRLDFKRVPYLERRQIERSSCGGPKIWIYRYGWGVWHRKFKKNY